jgi:hypothetical protein
MDFYEVVRQATKLLQERGRLTYRTLKRQFDLDDEALEDLKDALLFSHPVVDEDSRGMAWTGDPAPPGCGTQKLDPSIFRAHPWTVSCLRR